MLSKSVSADLQRARSLHAAVYTWNELSKHKRYVWLLKYHFPASEGWQHLFLDTHNAITVNTNRERVVETIYEELSPAQGWIPQPKRVVTGVVLEHVPTGRRRAVLNMHFTNGAFNRQHLVTRKVRRRRWQRELAAAEALVLRLIGTGLTVWWAGDLNTRERIVLHPNQVTLVHDEVMHMAVCLPPKHRLVHQRPCMITGLKTDHPGLFASSTVARQPRR
jgi:hypothetical protein